jgi:hypothetical protein
MIDDEVTLEDSIKIYQCFIDKHKQNRNFAPISIIKTAPQEIPAHNPNLSIFSTYDAKYNNDLIRSLQLFNYGVFSLESWQTALEEMTDSEKGLAFLNHLDALIMRVVGFPYTLKDKVLKSAIALSAIVKVTKNEFGDKAISLEVSELERRLKMPRQPYELKINSIPKIILSCGNYKQDEEKFIDDYVLKCDEWNTFRSCRGELNNREFVKETKDLRNKLNHSFSRNIITGQSPRITLLNSGYAHGVEEPIQIPELILPLKKQVEAARGTYKTYAAYIKRLWEELEGHVA